MNLIDLILIVPEMNPLLRVYRGGPPEPRGPLVVSRRGAPCLPGPQRQPGAQHGAAALHRHDVP